MSKNPDHKSLVEDHVNSVARSIRAFAETARATRGAITKTNVPKIVNYLQIQLDNMAADLQRLAETNVPMPGEFTLDAEIPAPAAHPTKPVYRTPEPEGRLVGQRKPAAVTPDTEDVSFIDD